MDELTKFEVQHKGLAWPLYRGSEGPLAAAWAEGLQRIARRALADADRRAA